jgi:hypothetical protein
MAELGHKVKCALDEARMLILGSQVLLGFQFRSFFETRFDELPLFAQRLKFVSLFVMLLVLLLLLLPAAFHRIVERGEATREQHRFTTSVMDFALLPFAVVLAAAIYVTVLDVLTRAAALVWTTIGALVTLFFWYGLGWANQSRRKGGRAMSGESTGRTPLKEKIEQVLTECRVALPGVQALLGFQFATTLMEGFQNLPESSKLVHLASLGCMALSMVLLITPAAFHRLAEDGEDTERFHRFASVLLLAALVPLACGISGDVFVVARKLMGSAAPAVGMAAGALVLFLATWFGLTIYVRTTRRQKILRKASEAI